MFYWFIDQLMIEVSRSWCITPIDDEIMPFVDNAMMDITHSSVATRSCHDVHVAI
jgi:hypothetical protein